MTINREYGLIARHALGYAITRVLLLFILMVVDPFGAVSGSGERSRSIWEQVYAEQYFGDRLAEAKLKQPDDPQDRPKDPPGRDATTVLMMDAAGWNELAPGGQPSSFEIYDLVAQLIAPPAADGGRPPKAIFVDLAVGAAAPDGVAREEFLRWDAADVADCTLRTKPGLSPFRCLVTQIGELTHYPAWKARSECFQNSVAKIACIRQAGGLPILFADARNPGPSASASTDAGYGALDAVAVLVPVDYDDPAEYQQISFPKSEAGNKIHYRLHPPAALFAVHCGLGLHRPEPGAPPCARTPPYVAPTKKADAPEWRKSYWGWSDDYARTGALVWGIGAESRFTEEMISLSNTPFAAHCRTAGGGGMALVEMGRQAARGLNFRRIVACPYPKQISYAELGRLTPRQVDMALDNRLVIVGDDRDFVDNKLSGRVHGAVWHAMALDNLISFEADYPKAPRRLLGLMMTDHDLVNLVAALLVLLPGACIIIWGRLRNLALGDRIWPTRREWSTRLVALLITLLLFAVVVQLMTARGYGWAAHFNYIALSIVCLVEFIAVVAVLLDPIRKSLLNRFGWMRFFYDELPVGSDVDRDSSERDPTVGKTDVFVGNSSDDGDAGKRNENHQPGADAVR